MINIIVMGLCLGAGQIIRRGAGLSIRDARPLNVVVLWLSLPALILAEVPALFHASGLTKSDLFAIATPWIGFLCASGVIVLMARWRRWSREVVGALILTVGLGNTSFVGLPVVETLYGTPGLRPALLIDQLGTFLILATLGLLVASICAGRDLRVATVVRRVALFPPFVAILLALGWSLSGWDVNETVLKSLQKIGATLVPLALLSVGWQLEIRASVLKTFAGRLSTGLIFKLLIWPAFVFVLLRAVLFKTDLVYHVSVIESAMPPMITGAVVASEFGLESELAQLMVGVGLPISLLTLSLWAWLLKAL